MHDNVALYEACRHSARVCLAFVLDPALLRGDRVGAPIVQAFFNALDYLRAHLRALGSDLALLEGDFARELVGLAGRLNADSLFWNDDYEPLSLPRDEAVTEAFRSRGLETRSFLDHVYFGADEVAQNDGRSYRIFTPYRKRWLDQRQLSRRLPVPSAAALAPKLVGGEAIGTTRAIPTPEDYGHRSSADYPQVSEGAGRALLDAFLQPGGAVERYKEMRDFPAAEGTSRLSPHLRAGTVGIRECFERAFARADESAGEARAGIETWISELIWREFYQMVLARFPHVATGAFLERANGIPWRDGASDFLAWCEGRTGYPIIDAAMRQLNTYGWMHNRLRMIVASFLTKDLLIDWRRGERYFEQRLADADLAQNNGGWQWAASTGTDAVPYFRIFNPVRQSRRFDPDGSFIRSMVPELRDVPGDHVHEPHGIRGYAARIVSHEAARARAIAAFSGIFGASARSARP